MALRSTRFWLTTLFLGALALRLGFAAMARTANHPIPPPGQAREYILAGSRLLEFGTLTSPLIIENGDHGPSSVLPPIYAALVAGVYGLFGTESTAASIVLFTINAIATALCVVGVFFIARRIGGNVAAWVAAIVVTINPTLFGFTTYIWDTSLFCLGVTVAVLISMRLGDGPAGRWRWVGFGLYLGLLALLNPALTVAYPFLVLWPLTKTHGWRIKPLCRGVSLTVLGWIVAITPWTIRNYVHFGELMYIRGGLPIELWLAVCPQADGVGGSVYREQFPLLNEGVQRHVATVGERAYIDECRERAYAAMSADPWRYVRLSAVRAVDYFLGTVYSHVARGESGWPVSTSRAVMCTFLGAESIAILLLALVRTPRNDIWWLLAIVVSFSVIYCLTHIFVRFRAPTEPLVAVILAVLAAGRTSSPMSHVASTSPRAGPSETVADGPDSRLA